MLHRHFIIALLLFGLSAGDLAYCWNEHHGHLVDAPNPAEADAVVTFPFALSDVEAEQVEYDRCADKQAWLELCRSFVERTFFVTPAPSVSQEMQAYLHLTRAGVVPLLLCDCARLERSGVFLS